VRAGRQHRRRGNQIRIDGARLRGVYRCVHGADLAQAHLCDRIEQPWVDLQPLRINHFRPGGNAYVCTHSRDLSVVNDNSTVFDRRSR